MYEPRLAAVRGVLAAAQPAPPPPIAKENARVARCMWCNFACTRSGDLLEHFRSSHPSEYCASEERFKMAMRDKVVVGASATTTAADAARAEQLFGGGDRRGSCSSFATEYDRAVAAASSTGGDCGPPRAVGGGGAACPHCHVDCLTRKKLMSHIEAAHKTTDDDDDVDDDDGEPPVKVIRLKRSGGDLIQSLSAAGVERISPALGKLLKAIRPEDIGAGGRGAAGATTPHAAASMPAAAAAAAGVPGKSRGGASVGGVAVAAASGLMGDVRVLTLPSGSLARVADKKYKCFWCNALFRKRGKLMDHIDLFHKDSKQQTEVEAEMLNSAAAAARKDTTLAAVSSDGAPPQRAAASALLCGGDAAAAAEGDGHPTSAVRRGGPAPTTTPQRPPAAVAPAHSPCRFVYRAPVHRLKPEDAAADAYGTADDDRSGCKFYFGKSANPLAAGRPPAPPPACAAAVVGCAKGAAAMQWPAPPPFPPTCYFYAGGGAGGPAPVHHQYKPAAVAPVPSLELPYLLLCGGGGRPMLPYREDDGGGRARLPIMPSPTEAAVLSQHYAAAARLRAAEEYPLDLSSRLR